MKKPGIGVAVIGAGMAGRAHAHGYRAAPEVFGTDLPEVRLVAVAYADEAVAPDTTRRYGGAREVCGTALPEVRLVAVADAYEPFAQDTARRYGYERAETSWEAIADAPDIDAVSVVVANRLHREIVEGLLAAGKHVLCEKPLAPTVADGEAMVERAAKSDQVAAVGFTFRRSPAISAVREQVSGGVLGAVRHFNGHYWCDYGFPPDAPMSWRYLGGRGSGALADIGTHLVDVGEFLCGPVRSVRGALLETLIGDPAGAPGGGGGA